MAVLLREPLRELSLRRMAVLRWELARFHARKRIKRDHSNLGWPGWPWATAVDFVPKTVLRIASRILCQYLNLE